MKFILPIFLFILCSNYSIGQEKISLNNTQKSLSNKSIYLTLEKKCMGLSTVWSEAKRNFVFYEQVKSNWDSLYLACLSKIKKTNTIKEYYDTLKYFCAQLHDGHTTIIYPDSYYDEFGRIAIRTRLVENKVVVTEILNDSLLHFGISVGTEILKINDMGVKEYANKYIRPMVCASTPQDVDNRTYNYELLSLKNTDSLKLTLSKNGKTSSIYVKAMTRKKMKVFDFKVIDGDVGLLTLNSFEDDNFYKKFDTIYSKIIKTSALIIDVRNNGGGDDNQGHYILKHLLTKSYLGAMVKTAQYNSYYNGAREFPASYYSISPWEYQTKKGIETYTKSVVLLTSERTFSAAENFAMEFDYTKRGVLVGRPTGGSTGMPAEFALPFGGAFRVCTKDDMYPDGKKFIGIGIIPNEIVKENVVDIANGKDLDIEKALMILKKKTN